jgi:hypothetical protein
MRLSQPIIRAHLLGTLYPIYRGQSTSFLFPIDQCNATHLARNNYT